MSEVSISNKRRFLYRENTEEDLFRETNIFQKRIPFLLDNEAELKKAIVKNNGNTRKNSYVKSRKRARMAIGVRVRDQKEPNLDTVTFPVMAGIIYGADCVSVDGDING